MKQHFVRRSLALILCLCVAFTLFTTMSPAKSVHAATVLPDICPAQIPVTRYFENWDMYTGEFLLGRSCFGQQLKLIYQTDGNLVLYRSGKAVWATNTVVQYPYETVAQLDGNFVVYAHNYYTGKAYPVWASGTAGKGSYRITLQGDSNLVIYDVLGSAIWASNTACFC